MSGSTAPRLRVKVARAPGVVTTDDVRVWIVDATATKRRVGKSIAADAPEVARIATLVSAFAAHYRRDRSKEAGADVMIARLRDVQQATRTLRERLPGLIADYERGGVIEPIRDGGEVVARVNPEYAALRALAEAVDRAAGLGFADPPSTGRARELWLTWAAALLEPIRLALKGATGRDRISAKPDGALIAVLCAALAAIDGRAREAAGVASGLKRRGLK